MPNRIAMSVREADVLRAIITLGNPMPHYDDIASRVWGKSEDTNARKKVQQAISGLEKKGYIRVVTHQVRREIIVL